MLEYDVVDASTDFAGALLWQLFLGRPELRDQAAEGLDFTVTSFRVAWADPVLFPYAGERPVVQQ